MTFELLRFLSDTKTWTIEAMLRDGSRERVQINSNYTAHAEEKLARYDGAEVVRITPTVTSWPFGPVNTLEVKLRV